MRRHGRILAAAAAAAVLGATLCPATAHAAGGFGAVYGAGDPLHGLGDGYSVSTYVTADVDGDGDLDVVVREPLGDAGLVLLRNDGGTFVETSAPFAGIAFAPNPANFVNTRVLVGDFDVDGDVDLWHHGVGFAAFYRNDGATFSEHTGAGDPLAALGARDPGTYVVIDVDGDTDPDVVVRDATTDASIDLLRNDGGTFVETSAPFGAISFASSPSNFVDTCVLVLDADDDGDLDLWHQGVGFAALYRNDGATFSEHTGADDPLHELATYDTHSYVTMDVDSDGDLDVVAREPVSDVALDVFRNDGGSFTRLTGGASPFAAVSLAVPGDFQKLYVLVGDHDGDGDADLYNQALNELYRQSGSAPVLATRTPATGSGAVPVTTDLVLGFGDAVALGRGHVVVRDASTGAVLHRLDVDTDADAFAGAGTSTITVHLPAPLPFATTVAVTVEPGAFRATTDGAAFAGVAPIAWRFTTAAGTPPTLTNLDGDTVTFTEGDPPVPVDLGADAAVGDDDGIGFGGGELTASVTAGGAADEDVLSIGLFEGVGSVTVPLGPSDDAAAVQSLVRALTYRNDGGDAPTAGPRSVTVTLADGGGLSASATATVEVHAVDDPPALVAPASLTAAAGTSVAVGPVAVTDPDSALLHLHASVDTGHLGGGADAVDLAGSPDELATAASALAWTAPPQPGTGTLTITVDDGTSTDTVTVALHALGAEDDGGDGRDGHGGDHGSGDGDHGSGEDPPARAPGDPPATAPGPWAPRLRGGTGGDGPEAAPSPGPRRPVAVTEAAPPPARAHPRPAAASPAQPGPHPVGAARSAPGGHGGGHVPLLALAVLLVGGASAILVVRHRRSVGREASG